MIRIGGNTILLLFPDGSAIPFDPAELQERLEKALTGSLDAEDLPLAHDIALAAEMMLWKNLRGEPSPSVKAETLDFLVVGILQKAGLNAAAEAFRGNSILKNICSKIPAAHLSTFLEEKLDLHGDALARISEKVFNTLKSIGADASSPGLALALARHFREVAAGKISVSVQPPDFTPDKICTIRPEELEGLLSSEARIFFEKRILKVHPVNLRIFPAIRLDLRLTGLASSEGLLAPLTELTLAPAFIRAARAADETLLAADKLFRKHGNESDVPAKLLLHLSDAELFTREWMGCSSTLSQEKCAENLCRNFASELTRIPVRLTCG